MRFNSARQVLTDALSIHHTSPDPDAVKVDIYWKDNDSRIAHCCEAGKVLRVVSMLPPILNTFCYVMYGPDVNKDEMRVKVEVIANYAMTVFEGTYSMKGIKGNFRARERFHVLSKLAAEEVQFLEWNGRNKYSDADVARELSNMDKRNYERHWKSVFNNLKGIIHDLAPKALGPVAELVEIEKEKYVAY